MRDPYQYAAEFQREGFAVFEGVLSAQDVKRLRDAVASIPDGDEVRRRQSVYGVRNLLEVCEDVRWLASQPKIRQFVTPILGDDAFAARAVFFDKVPDANWALGWHQDSVISVKERQAAPGFVAWSQKAGVWQVQPPPGILAQMVAVRVHLDDCMDDNGPLRVIPCSHRDGWVEDNLAEWKSRGPVVTCSVRTGGVVVMCPLILHASSKSQQATHRRVIHIEFACGRLPANLEWNNRIGADYVATCSSAMPASPELKLAEAAPAAEP